MANEKRSLATYVSDMLALERHIRVPFGTQQKDDDFRDYTDASALVTRLVAVTDTHIQELQKALEQLGGQETAPVKKAVVEFEGFFAGAIDKMRKTKVSKALRDDYTALSLCTASYSLLLTTANGLGDATISSLAQRFLQDYAQLTMDIGDALPSVATAELLADGLDVDTSTIERSRSQINAAWQAGSRQAPEPATSYGVVESAVVRETSDDLLP